MEKGNFKQELNLDETGEKLKQSLLAYFETLNPVEKEKMIEVLDSSLTLHANQKNRPDGPYVNHILRVAERVVDDFNVQNTAIISAALLHDSVEDQSEKLSALITQDSGTEKEKALAYIEQKFGKETARIVLAVTNSDELENMEADEKNKQYAEHIAEAIQDKNIFYVKFSDFSDNGLNIKHMEDAERQKKLAKKYLPLYNLFIDRIKKEDIEIPGNKKEEYLNRLVLAKHFAESITKEK